MAVYKQFNTNEVVISPFKANKRFRFENNQVTSSDVQIEYYQSQQGTYLSGSFDTGFNTMQDGVNIFNSIKQLYYSNYLTSSYGDPMVTMSFIAGQPGPQQQNLGYGAYNGNITGPRFENFLQSSLTQDRKFAQFSASAASIGFAGTDTGVSQSIAVVYGSTVSVTEIGFTSNAVPDLVAAGIDDTYVLDTLTWDGGLATTPFSSIFPDDTGLKVGAVMVTGTGLPISSGVVSSTVNTSLDNFTTSGNGVGATATITWNANRVTTVTVLTGGSDYKVGDSITITAGQLNAITSPGTLFTGQVTFLVLAADVNTETITIKGNLLAPQGVSPNIDGANVRGLTLRDNNTVTFVAGGAGNITLNYLQAPRGPSVISIPSMLFGEAIQPSSFQFEYTSSLNYTRSIIDDDGQGNLIVTQSNSTGVPFFSGSVGQIFYSQGIAVITGPDSGNLREFAYNVGYKNNMNPNIISSSLSYSSSITIDENQYKCTVRNDEFSYTTNPSALSTPGVLTQTNNQIFRSFDAGSLTGLANNTYTVEPVVLEGNNQATTFYVFGNNGSESTIGQQYRVQLTSAGGTTLEFVGWDGVESGTRNGLGQVQFNSTGSDSSKAGSFYDAINSVDGFNGEISGSLQSTNIISLNRTSAPGNTALTAGNIFPNSSPASTLTELTVGIDTPEGTMLSGIPIGRELIIETPGGAQNYYYQKTGIRTNGAGNNYIIEVLPLRGLGDPTWTGVQPRNVGSMDTVKLTQLQAGSIGNTPIKYADSFNLLLNKSYLPSPERGQVAFGNVMPQPTANPQPTTGDDAYSGTNGALLEIVVSGAPPAVTSINVSSSISPTALVESSTTFGGRDYKVGDTLQIKGTDLGGTGFGFINLTLDDVQIQPNTLQYHDFITGSEFSPYVTTVGLYNANNDLVVVGKFPRPLPISLQTDTTYMINFDTN